MLPAPCIHADLAAPPALPWRTRIDPPRVSMSCSVTVSASFRQPPQVRFCTRERFGSPGRSRKSTSVVVLDLGLRAYVDFAAEVGAKA
jgi:hypothetical protein